VRQYRAFSYEHAHYRICCSPPEHAALIEEAIRTQRSLLEGYAKRQPEFITALEPLALLPGAPEAARLMQAAALLTGVGPMAAVAGTLAELAVRAALAAGAVEAIVDNGGDLFAASDREVTVALFAGSRSPVGGLAFRLAPPDLPLAVCSSSSRMGHSLSLGDCDLATVVSRDAALADAAATLAGNLVRRPEDIDAALERVAAIPGVAGVLIVKNDRVGLAGSLPELVRHADAALRDKVTRDPGSDFFRA
jgi:ApbE superfamily uncharacterized protein (UPF0280 family)